MSGEDEATRSLADQAASWVPPWERRPGSAEAPPEEPDEADEPAELPRIWAGIEDFGKRVGTISPPEDVTTDVPTPDPSRELMAEAPRTADVNVALVPVDEPDEEPVEEPVEPPAAEPDRPPLLEHPAELRGALEAILLVVHEPVSDVTLAQVLELPVAPVREALEELAAEYTGLQRGFELRRAAGGWRLYTRSDYATYVERFVLDGQQTRLTQAALETLAVIAYKQPVTRSRISAIRGVNCDGVVRTLVARGLIEDCGSEPDSGAFLYRTTPLFLEKLGIDSVDELPPLAPFLPDDVDEIANAQG
ncbi:SMC-Scp complex subunit ScpB [Planosporangium thailandense]|uniref:SMC-Scp complex subunit ScpB n=1 Tax=Planosporangium thailandense TaxID=765197 RepID=A0ABX0Y0E8_9ACTN|nr:SMC-Scp complex subunit ScpB [Planosporangium thailandense]